MSEPRVSVAMKNVIKVDDEYFNINHIVTVSAGRGGRCRIWTTNSEEPWEYADLDAEDVVFFIGQASMV